MLRELPNSGVEQCNSVGKDESKVCSTENENSAVSTDKGKKLSKNLIPKKLVSNKYIKKD